MATAAIRRDKSKLSSVRSNAAMSICWTQQDRSSTPCVLRCQGPIKRIHPVRDAPFPSTSTAISSYLRVPPSRVLPVLQEDSAYSCNTGGRWIPSDVPAFDLNHGMSSLCPRGSPRRGVCIRYVVDHARWLVYRSGLQLFPHPHSSSYAIRYRRPLRNPVIRRQGGTIILPDRLYPRGIVRLSVHRFGDCTLERGMSIRTWARGVVGRSRSNPLYLGSSAVRPDGRKQDTLGTARHEPPAVPIGFAKTLSSHAVSSFRSSRHIPWR
jgi:hypothetical protein